ncbi:MAG: PD40 domain-containing protein [Phycisphaerae bacterium]|nr:PD40 domain-containing protein [Phycisphaerae bacterium]
MDEAINHPSGMGLLGGSLSHDGLRLYFSMERDGGHGSFDIWVCERESLNSPWGEAVNLGPNINGPVSEESPKISHDELELYVQSGERGGSWEFQPTRKGPVFPSPRLGRIHRKEILAGFHHAYGGLQRRRHGRSRRPP